MKHKTPLAVAAVLATGIVLGAAILRAGAPHADGHGPATQAPHPVTAHQHDESKPHGEARVTFTDEQLQRSGITLAAAGPARIASMLELLGEVKLNQDRSVVVTPRLAGIVEAVRVNAGDRVARGQVLAVLSSPALAEQRGELLAARRRLTVARTTHDREKRLWEDKISAEQDYLAARQALAEADIAVEAAQQQLAALGAATTDTTARLAHHELRAPIDGVVVDKQISTGQAVKEDAAVFQLADLSSVWVEL
ncbi:MAG: HlyD family efflux transporter periplasmic adaptor subunit, partial [Rubrivivax sp.]